MHLSNLYTLPGQEYLRRRMGSRGRYLMSGLCRCPEDCQVCPHPSGICIFSDVKIVSPTRVFRDLASKEGVLFVWAYGYTILVTFCPQNDAN